MGLILLIIPLLLLFGGLPRWGYHSSWLRSLGHRRDDTNYRPDSLFLLGRDLRALSVVRPSAGLRSPWD